MIGSKNDMKNKVNANLSGKREAINDAIAYLKGKKIAKTQKQIAKLLDVNDANLSKALSGNEKYLTDSFIKKFADVFNLNANWFLTGEGSMLSIPEVAMTEKSEKKGTDNIFSKNKLSLEEKLDFLIQQNEAIKKENQEIKDMIDDINLLLEISLAPILRHFKLKADNYEENKNCKG